MPAKRTFSYEYLRQLVREHPDWSHEDYASALTAEARERTGDLNYRRVIPNAVAQAISRYRSTWAEDGLSVARRQGNGRVIEWCGIPEAYRMATPLRWLRVLEQLALGTTVKPDQARRALAWRRKMHERRLVVDLTTQGRPVVRPARPDEFDGEGFLLSLYARCPGLTEQEWASMSPAERRAASARWTTAA